MCSEEWESNHSLLNIELMASQRPYYVIIMNKIWSSKQLSSLELKRKIRICQRIAKGNFIFASSSYSLRILRWKNEKKNYPKKIVPLSLRWTRENQSVEYTYFALAFGLPSKRWRCKLTLTMTIDRSNIKLHENAMHHATGLKYRPFEAINSASHSIFIQFHSLLCS